MFVKSESNSQEYKKNNSKLIWHLKGVKLSNALGKDN